MIQAEKEKLIRSDILSIESQVRHAFNQGYDLGYKEGIKKNKKQPKTGHWIVHEKPNGIRYLECSCCNIWYLNEHLLRNSYCPNCGAKMVEPQESEGE